MLCNPRCAHEAIGQGFQGRVCGTAQSALGGDESDEIAALLTSAGYTVTLKCDDPAKCPSGRPVIEDFKNWGQYAAVVLVSHGDDDATNKIPPVVFTGVNLAAIGTDVRLDWLNGRIQVLGDGTITLTPSWFELYTGRMTGTVVYLSTCR